MSCKFIIIYRKNQSFPVFSCKVKAFMDYSSKIML